MTIKRIIEDLFADRIAIETLSDKQLCEAIEYLHLAAEGLQMDLDPAKVALAKAMIAILEDTEDDNEFATAIAEAESRGNTYWEFENPTVH